MSTISIPLTKGYHAVIDEADAHLILQDKWCVTDGGTERPRACRRDPSGVGLEFLHHRILPKKHGYDVDHIDGDSLNNRRANLRYATRTQNNYNQSVSRRNTSGCKGVAKCRKGWRAYATEGQQQKHIGVYDTFEQAKSARLKYENDNWGDFSIHARSRLVG